MSTETNTIYFTTENSAYQLDAERSRIRRLGGLNRPTPRQGDDGDWKQYEAVSAVAAGQPVVIVWRCVDDIAQSTMTSRVIIRRSI